MSPVPPPLPIAAAWPALEAPLLTPLAPAYFHLHAAVDALQDLEAGRARLMELSGVYEAHWQAFDAAPPSSPLAKELSGRMIDSMHLLDAARNQALEKAQRAYGALSGLPEFVRDEDLTGIRATLDAPDSDDPTLAFGRMTSYLEPLQRALGEQQVQIETRLRRKLDLLQRIIGGDRAMFGLPAVRFNDLHDLQDGMTQERAFEERYRALAERYAPGESEWIVQRRFERLARQVACAGTPEELCSALKSSRLPTVQEFIPAIQDFFAKKGPLNFAELSDDFGIRAKVEDLIVHARMDPEEIRALREMGIPRTLLLERPWTFLKPSARLLEEIEALKALAGGKLNPDRIEQVAREFVGAEPGYLSEIPDNAILEGRTIRSGDWRYGGHFEGASFDGWFSLAAQGKYAVQLAEALSVLAEELSKAGVPIQYRIAATPEGFRRPNGAAVFFRAEDQETVLLKVQTIFHEHPLFFREGHPLFALPLQDEAGLDLPGLAFGQEPSVRSVGFAGLRAGAVLEAAALARLIKKREPLTWQKFFQIAAYCLARWGIDPTEPALEATGTVLYDPLLEYSQHRSADVEDSDVESSEIT